MRASTHISVRPAPDYALRVPSHVLILFGVGLLGGVLGLGLLIAAPTVPALIGAFLLVWLC